MTVRRIHHLYRSQWESWPEDCRGVDAGGTPFLMVQRTAPGGGTEWRPMPVKLVENPEPGVRFYLMLAAAWIRGLFWRWPRMPPVSCPPWPPGTSSVVCSLPSHADVRGMWRMGWEPWCFHRTAWGSVARLFVVRSLNPEEEHIA